MLADVAAEKFVEIARAKLPHGTQVFPGPPAEDQPLDQAVWIDEEESEYDWRSLGVEPGNRSEEIVLTVVVAVYREGGDHLVVQAVARTVAADIERAIEEHVLGDTCDLEGTVTDALVSSAARTFIAEQKGWSRRIVLKITARSNP